MKGTVLWFTGLSGSGKTTIAKELHRYFTENNIACEILDGDLLRQFLSKDLGFSKEDRDKNIERAIFIANLLSKHGVIVLASLISPYKKHRGEAKKILNSCIEVFVNAPLDVCIERDPKGHYKKALSGEMKSFTGISDIYEPPESPDIELKTDQLSSQECTQKIIEYLKNHQII